MAKNKPNSKPISARQAGKLGKIGVKREQIMGRVGFEHPPVTVSKTPISEGGGAKSDAQDAPKAPKDPDLEIVVKAWPELPGHIKEAIKALIQTQNKP